MKLGSMDLAQYKPAEIHLHPDFNINNESTQGYDIALIKLDKPINSSSFGYLKENICLPEKSDVYQDIGTEYAMTAGWGGDAWSNKLLQMAYLKIVINQTEVKRLAGYEQSFITQKLNDQKICMVRKFYVALEHLVQ